VRKKSALGVWPFLVVAAHLLSRGRAKHNYHTLPEVVPIAATSVRPEEPFAGISVIVPARNEAANLPRLLVSLLQQDYPLYEILVVDDASTDETAAMVQSYQKDGVQLISLEGPPDGWTGKNYACWVGAAHAHYPWLLFVDADIELASCALRSTFGFLAQHGVRALSLFARQRCETFWERLLLPFAYQHYFVSTDARVNEGEGPALANGQYLVIRGDVYRQVGGHAAIAGSMIEDAALADCLKQAGVVVLACRGEQLVSVRMYTGLRQIVNGFGKNSYPYLHHSPRTGIPTALSTTLAASVALLFLEAGWKQSSPVFFLAVLAYSAQVLNALPWLKHFGLPVWYALLTPVAAVLFLAIAINSLLHSIAGHSITWKGRSYSTRHYRRFREPGGMLF
jgi:cellulose synthase/poly-beta-1,6-N-acetylglucosamine synthase-like glycosyltransferase